MWHALGTGEVTQVFGGEIRGKRPLGRRRCRWDGNIKMDLFYFYYNQQIYN